MKINFDKIGKFMKNRIKNKYLWTGLIALLVNMSLSGFIELPDNFENTANAILNILITLGIFNNPSTESQSIFIDVDGDGIDDRYDDEISTDEGSVG